jgi:Immunity protein Imm1
MFISQYSVEHWQGNQNQAQIQPATVWAAIEAAILQLDGDRHTVVTLEAENEAHMSVGGGPEQYVVYATLDNEDFPYLFDPSRSAESEETIVVGGQAGIYPARMCVNLATVLKAARTFAERGQMESSVVWTGDRVAEPV